MSTAISEPEQVAVASRRPRPMILLGGESLVAPKTGVEIGVLPDDSVEAREVHLSQRAAEAQVSRLMEDAADAALRRAERFATSSLAWNQAGFACLAGGRPKDAQLAFERALAIEVGLRGAQVGLARALFELGDADRAAAILSRVVLHSPDDTDAVVSLGVVLAHLGRTKDALQMLDSHSFSGLLPASLLAIRGNLYLAEGEPARAIADLRNAVRLKPDWIHARNALGVAHWKAGHREAAARHFRETLRIAPFYEESLLNLLRIMMVEQRFTEVLGTVLQRFGPTTASDRVGRIAGAAAFEMQQWHTAVSWWQCALEKTDNALQRARLLNDIGCAYGRRGDQSAAGRYFELSIQQTPTELAIVNRAKTYALEGAHLLAASWLETAPRPEEGESIGRRKVLAQALATSGQPERAISVARELLESGDADESVYALLGALLVDDMGDVRLAIEITERGLARFPRDPTLVNNLAYGLLMAGDVELAAVVLKQHANPDAVEGMFLTATRGLLALKQGNLLEGRRLYEEALAAAGTDAMRDRVRAKRDLEIARAIIARDGNREEAAKLLQRASVAGRAAAPYAEHAVRELLRLGVAGHGVS